MMDISFKGLLDHGTAAAPSARQLTRVGRPPAGQGAARRARAQLFFPHLSVRVRLSVPVLCR